MASHKGHLQIVKRLLEIDGVVEQAISNDNKALNSAIAMSHRLVANCLLELPDVARLAKSGKYALVATAALGDCDNMMQLLKTHDLNKDYTCARALDWAALNGHTDMVDLLIEQPRLRYDRYHSESSDSGIKKMYQHSLKRALWLELQKSSDFENVNNLEQFTFFVEGFLEEQYRPHDSSRFDRALAKCLINQIRSLAYYNPFIASPNHFYKSVTYESLATNLGNLVQKFVDPPKSLKHFNEPTLGPSLRLATRCLTTHYRDAQAKRAQQSGAVGEDSRLGSHALRRMV